MKKIGLLFVVILLFSSGLYAQEAAFWNGVSNLVQKRELLAEKINKVQQEIQDQAGSFPPEFQELIQHKMDLLKQLDLTVGQRNILERQTEAGQKLAIELAKQNKSILQKNVLRDPPYDFFFLDKITDELSQLDSERENLTAVKANALRQVDLAGIAFTDKEKARRKIKEANASRGEGELTLVDDLRLEVAELESLLSKEWLEFKKQEIKNTEADLANLKAQEVLISKKLAWVLPRTSFSEENLKNRLKRIETLESSFVTEIETARKQLVHQEGSLTLKKGLSPRDIYVSELKRESLESRYDLLASKLRRSPIIREIWSRRYAVFNKLANRQVMRDWRRESQDYLAQLNRDYTRVGLSLSDIRKRILAKDKQVDEEMSTFATKDKALLEEIASLHEESLASIETSRKMHRKLLSEIENQLIEANLNNYARDSWNFLVGFLDTEIISVDDRPITVGKLALALFLLLLTLTLSRRLSRFAGSKIIRRFQLQEGPRQAVERLIYYALILVMTLVSLYIANVPLTLFTVLGGALAIGVGFGSQNIINNFISSLILMVEQPIRVGDLIEVGDMTGRVQKIGARCTQVRTFANVDILVPNSVFLEKNVMNATLSDDLMRTQILVGVAYGTDTRLVENLLTKIAGEHSLVVKDPAPIVLFSDFGDNLLLFKLEFRTRLISGQDRRVVESDLRHHIVSVFAENSIAIDYPQRDVHLNTVSPIQIDILK